MITNREWASIILLTAFLAWAFRSRDVRTSAVAVVKALVSSRLLTMLVLYVAYIGGLVWLAARIDVWTTRQLKDTVIWFLVAGFGLLFSFRKASGDERFFRRAIITTFGLSVFLEFFLNITAFSLPVELVLQVVVVVLVGLSVVTADEPQHAILHRICDWMLGLIGLALLIGTIAKVYGQRHELDLSQLWRSLALVIWLPILALPFVFVVALVSGYELTFMRMTFANKRISPSLTVRLGVIAGFNVHLYDLHAFSGQGAGLAATARNFSTALQAARRFRLDRSNRLA
jgi:hypothetical protein